MKTATQRFGLAAAVFALGCIRMAWADQPQMRDAATHDQLVQKLRKVSQNDPMKNMEPAKGEDPSVANRPKDILAESDVICFGGYATLVPKRAILMQPESLADRGKMKPGAKLVPWMDFFARNRAWITTVEVSRTQAEGNEVIAEDTRKRISESANLVVATYQGGPISVLPPKTPQPKDSTKP